MPADRERTDLAHAMVHVGLEGGAQEIYPNADIQRVALNG